jgi:DNA relaxase NicK
LTKKIIAYKVVSLKEYIVSKHIDYLTFTSKFAEPVLATKVYQLIKSPLNNYDMCEQYQSGMLHCWHSRIKEVGHHFIFSGSCLEWLRQHGHDERKLVKSVLERGKISRIDIAITSHAEDSTVHEFNPQNVAIATMAHMLVSRMKPAKDIAENLITQTKYIGSRTKRTRLFRAYDKGLDNKELENILVRYELETRKGTHTVAKAVIEGKDYGAIMRRYIDFPEVEAWIKIMSAEPATMSHAEPVLSAQEQDILNRANRWEWLKNSIAPVIAKAINEDFDKDGLTMENNLPYHDFIAAIVTRIKNRNIL